MPNKRTIPRVCQRCGDDFLANAYAVSVGKALYCGRPCYRLSLRLPGEAIVDADGTARIPLYARDGSVVAWALIDAADAAWAAQWRWSFQSDGYVYRSVTVNGRDHRLTIYLHRELLGLTPGDGVEGDHRNRDHLDNRRVNLRAIPHVGNAQNMPSRVNASSAHRGVSWDKSRGKWAARVNVGGTTVHLGRFDSESAAAQAAEAGRRRLLPHALD